VYGFLRFVIFFGTLVALLVLVGVPAVASPLLTQMVRDEGLRADDMRVTVAFFDPTLLLARTERLRIEATGVDLGPAHALGMDLSLGRVALLDRTFESITGNVREVSLRAGGMDITVDRVEVDGPAEAANVAAHFTPAQSSAVVRQAARLIGFGLDDVHLLNGRVEIELAGVRTGGTLSVEGGALVLRPQIGPTLLLIQPAPTDPWRLTDVRVAPDGVTISGVVDAESLARRVRAGG
jgi:hypothetical protein